MTPAELCAECKACCDGTKFTSYRSDDGKLHSAAPCKYAGRCDEKKRPRNCLAYECDTLRALKRGTIDDTEALRQVRQLREKPKPKEKAMQPSETQITKFPIDEAVVARAAGTAIATVCAAHQEGARLRALQQLSQYIKAEVQTQAAEALAAKGAVARARRTAVAGEVE